MSNDFSLDNSNCDLGDIRLVDGPQNYSGRVEICLDNQWGTLCGDILIDDIADTVCGQLGFASQGTLYTIIYTYGLVKFKIDFKIKYSNLSYILCVSFRCCGCL